MTDFNGDEAKKILEKKTSKWPTQKDPSFSKPPILNIFHENSRDWSFRIN
jgi:hypothetical protein